MFAYPGPSLMLLRSFAKHQPGLDLDRRTVVVLVGQLSNLFYLNNNLHVVHHARSELPWYTIPNESCPLCVVCTSQKGKHAYPGYPSVLRRFPFYMRDHSVHLEYRLAQASREKNP